MLFSEWLNSFQIYCDLDGVLVDLAAGTGAPPAVSRMTLMRQVVLATRKKGIDEAHFWAELPWTPDGHTLWAYISNFNPIILTGGTGSSGASEGKKAWCSKNLGSNVKVIVTSADKKQQWASPQSILIDDYVKNIEEWRASGGIGILHKSAVETIQQLKMFTR